MDRIELPLCHLHETVSRFVVPSAALRDIRALQAQIELRRLALRDIEVIRCRLRPLMRRGGKRLVPSLRKRRSERRLRQAPAFRARGLREACAV
jgi:hypothetical protein